MGKNTSGEIKLKLEVGASFRAVAARFDAEWEFDCPVAVLSPFVTISEYDAPPESLIESVLIDIAAGDKRYDETQIWFGPDIEQMKKDALDILDGKEITRPERFFQVSEYEITFIENDDPDFEVNWEIKLLRKGSAIFKEGDSSDVNE